MNLDKWGPMEVLQFVLVALFSLVTAYLLVTSKQIPDALWGIDGTIVGYFFMRATEERAIRQTIQKLKEGR